MPPRAKWIQKIETQPAAQLYLTVSIRTKRRLIQGSRIFKAYSKVYHKFTFTFSAVLSDKEEKFITIEHLYMGSEICH